jgi:hypothetical protein
MKQQELSVLSNVIAVARRELADRDDKEIPPHIRRVAKCGGGRLPPPFQAALVKELRSNETFRESVLERWENEDIQDAVGYAFLTDPEGGSDKVVEQADARELKSVEEELARSVRTIRSLEDQIAEAKTRLADETSRHMADVARQSAAAVASRSSLEDAGRRMTMRIAELEAEQDAHSVVEAELRSEKDDLVEKLERSVTRARKRAQRDHVKARQPMSPPSDPVEFAAWLDSVERQQRSFRQARGAYDEVVQEFPPLRIPSGLLPDSREALLALIDQMPDAIYIDGYNVGAMLVEDFATAKARATVVAIADRLAVTSRARVVVVFDAVGVEGRPSAPSKGPADVRFSLTQIADDEIVQLLRANPSRNAVITSDRELSDRCAAEGCVTVWSEALVQWANG